MSILKLSQEKKSAEKFLLEFSVPILEQATVNNKFLIKGTAINETITHNGHNYVAEELSLAATGLTGKPLLKNHSNDVDSIIGKVEKAWWDSTIKSVQFEAFVSDKKMQDMIKERLISTVSIGAFAKDLVHDEETDSYIAKGLEFAELSLVAVPADKGATFAVAFAENFKLKETELEEMLKCPECDKQFDDKKKLKAHMNKAHPDEAEESFSIDNKLKGGLKKEMTESKVDLDNKTLSEMESLKSELALLKAEKRTALVEKYKSVCKDKKVKEKDVLSLSDDAISFLVEQLSEIKIEEKTELKGQVTPTMPLINTEGLDNFMYERSSRGIAIFALPDKMARKVLIR